MNEDVMVCHGMITHSPKEACEFCKQVRERFEEDFCGTYYRTGIQTIRNEVGCFERCDLHGRLWFEGENFIENGGHACSHCIKLAQVIPLEERDTPQLDKCFNKC